MSPLGGHHALSETTWRRGALAAFVLLVLVFGFFLRKAESETGEVRTHVTHIEAASPCLTYGPHSAVCKESFEKAVATINRPEACAILRKADLEPSACKGVHLKIERIEERRGTSVGGDASQPGSTGSQPASPSPGGHTGGAVTPHGTGVKDEPGSNSPHQPSNSTEEPPPFHVPKHETPAAYSPETHEEPSPPASPEATPAAKQPIREAVESVKEAVCTVNALGARICIP